MTPVQVVSILITKSNILLTFIIKKSYFVDFKMSNDLASKNISSITMEILGNYKNKHNTIQEQQQQINQNRKTKTSSLQGGTFQKHFLKEQFCLHLVLIHGPSCL